VTAEKSEARSGGSLWYEAWLRFRRNRLAMVGLVMVITVVLVALFAPVVAPYDPFKQLIWTEGKAAKLAAPSAAHLMGTDLYGRDILSRVIFGSRISLQIGIFATLVSLLIGIPLGALAGYMGGWVDDLISWLVNVIFAFPFLLFVLAVVAVFKNPSMIVVYMAIGLVNWVAIARVVRAQFISLREREFVEAARSLGLPPWRVIFVHILPNALAPPTPSWGLMISVGQKYLGLGKWWWAIFPGLAIMYTVLAFNFLGDGLRDALDVRLKR
jgi:peptide/nickel transport system permease protein/oligopeptide transport system permease protein